jgi:hypothetical protein
MLFDYYKRCCLVRKCEMLGQHSFRLYRLGEIETLLRQVILHTGLQLGEALTLELRQVLQ